MGDNRTGLPEGTDTIIEGAANTGGTPGSTQGIGTQARSGAAAGSTGGGDETVVASDTTLVSERTVPSPSGASERPAGGDGSSESGIRQRLRSGSEKLTGQAAEKTRGLVSQGLERSAEALANVGKLVGDTATGLDERLGPEYGEYARRAAAAIENTANSIASKDPDELIDDTREFVRRSPGVAIAGAAILGFAVARLIKSGLESSRGAGRSDDES